MPLALPNEMEIGLLTGCQDRPYAFGLAMALRSQGVHVDVIGGDEVDSPEFHTTPKVNFLNLAGRQRPNDSIRKKAARWAKYYIRLLRYSAAAKPGLLHILWNNKFEYYDRTFLLLYYKLMRKKIALTAHNVNQAKRDSNDTVLNRFTLRMQYRLVDHIFVHTEKMKAELHDDFGVSARAITVIRHPINNAFPDTALTPAEARQRLGLTPDQKVMLFFGRIRPYKGIEYLLAALERLVARQTDFRLIIAGEVKKGSEDYAAEIARIVNDRFRSGQVIAKMQFIPDEDAEVYLKAADVLVLPYKDIFQSGVLFLGYSYGLPVIATDVGAFREEIVEGQTGFLCRPDDPAALAETIETYFASDLYRELDTRRLEIRNYANAHHSWEAVAKLTCDAYAQLLESRPA